MRSVAFIIRRPTLATADVRQHANEAEIRWRARPATRAASTHRRSRKGDRAATGVSAVVEALLLAVAAVGVVAVMLSNGWLGGVGI